MKSIQRFLLSYHNLPVDKFQNLKTDIGGKKMTFVATTITEHYVHKGEFFTRLHASPKAKSSNYYPPYGKTIQQLQSPRITKVKNETPQKKEKFPPSKLEKR